MATPFSSMNTGQQKFAREFTRNLLVDWAHQCLSRSDGLFQLRDPSHDIYLDVARERKWVSSKNLQVLGSGYTAASGMLKR